MQINGYFETIRCGEALDVTDAYSFTPIAPGIYLHGVPTCADHVLQPDLPTALAHAVGNACSVTLVTSRGDQFDCLNIYSSEH